MRSCGRRHRRRLGRRRLHCGQRCRACPCRGPNRNGSRIGGYDCGSWRSNVKRLHRCIHARGRLGRSRPRRRRSQRRGAYLGGADPRGLQPLPCLLALPQPPLEQRKGAKVDDSERLRCNVLKPQQFTIVARFGGCRCCCLRCRYCLCDRGCHGGALGLRRGICKPRSHLSLLLLQMGDLATQQCVLPLDPPRIDATLPAKIVVRLLNLAELLSHSNLSVSGVLQVREKAHPEPGRLGLCLWGLCHFVLPRASCIENGRPHSQEMCGRGNFQSCLAELK